MTPEIYVEMHLIFDNEFDVNTITKHIGIQPFQCMNKVQTRINSLTGQRNPGFWTVRSETFTDFNAERVINDFISNIECKVELLREICLKNKGSVVFDIVPSFYYNDKPAIYFNRNFLKIVDALEAEIELDIYVFDKDEKTNQGTVL